MTAKEEFEQYLEAARKVLAERFPDSRQISLAKTKLEEAELWVSVAPHYEKT